MDYSCTAMEALDTFTQEFGLSPPSMSPAPGPGVLEPFASPKEALEALFQTQDHTSWDPPSTTTTILDQASFPPSVFVFSDSPSTHGPPESRSGEGQKPTLFDSPLGRDTMFSAGEGDPKVGTLSLRIPKTSTAVSADGLVYDRCPVNPLNMLRPVEPIKGTIRKHKQYLTVCYQSPSLP
jgi:hypothetical protein